MRRTICVTVAVLFAVLIGGALLSKGRPVVAGAADPAPVSFTVNLAQNQTRVLGVIPPNKTLTLHDFHVDQSVGLVDVLADGLPVSPAMVLGSGVSDADHLLSFVQGITVQGGAELSIRRRSRFASGPIDLYVAGNLK